MIINMMRCNTDVPLESWPFYIPAIRQIVSDGFRFAKPITFIVGENGSGKSTIIEAIAEAYGLDVRGGHGGRKYAVSSDQKSPLAQHLTLELTNTGMRTKAKQAQGFFLRSETALGVFEYMSDYNVPGYGDKHIGTVSHGEGYLQVLLGRFTGQGLYLLDEPEAALSFNSSLALLKQLKQVVQNGSQVICVTHSPILTALSEADILEANEHGLQKKAWSELALTKQWRR